MAEARTEATKVESKDKSVTKAGDGSITYEDHGTYWLEIDNRGEHTIRQRLPKSLRDVPVTPRIHEEVKARMQGEHERKQAALEEEAKPEEAPPVEDPERDYETDPVDVVVTHKGEAKKSGEDK